MIHYHPEEDRHWNHRLKKYGVEAGSIAASDLPEERDSRPPRMVRAKRAARMTNPVVRSSRDTILTD